ncbi:hypothetical protein BDV06DRAFT_214517 [Aspergillus oleicola]
MSYPILPMGASGSVHPRKHYVAILKDLICDCTDSIYALNHFNTLISADGPNCEDSFKAFDSHGGDTACHLRASMLTDMYEYWHTQHKTCERIFGEEIRPFLKHLEDIRMNAQQTCLQLTKKPKANPESFGFDPKRDSCMNIVKHLGWLSPNAGNGSRAGSPPPFSSGDSPDSAPSSNSTSSGSSLTVTSLGSESTIALASRLSSLSISSSLESLAAINRDIRTEPEWNVADLEMCIFFLAGAKVLADHKEFTRRCSNISVHFIPEQAMQTRDRVMEGYWDPNDKDYHDFKINRIKDRHCHLQKWMSRLSCSLLSTVTHQSPRAISVVAAFPAFLVCRAVWASRRWPVLLLNRHFCSHGYHVRAYTTVPTIDCGSAPSDCDSEFDYLGVGIPGDWSLTRVSLETLATDPVYTAHPYITILGNSIQGTQMDYLDAAYRDDGHHDFIPYHEDSDEHCIEKRVHEKNLLRANHCQHPFPVSEENEAVLIAEAGPGVKELKSEIDSHREKDAAKATELGAAPDNAKLLLWEHVFAETPKRVLPRRCRGRFVKEI